MDQPDLLISIEEDRLVEAFGGRIRDVAAVLEFVDHGIQLCRFGREELLSFETGGSSLILHERGRAEAIRLRRLEEKPVGIAVEPLHLSPPVPIPEARVRQIERELARRLEVDQDLRRRKPPISPFPWMESDGLASNEAMLGVMQTAENTGYLRALVLEVGWIDAGRFSFDAANAAFLLVQHSGDLPLMLAALPGIKADAEQGRLDWEPYALLFDRVQLSLGKRQRYGTQLGRGEGGEFEVLPVVDERGLAELRRKAGLLPLAEYVKLFGATEVRLSSACAPRNTAVK